MTMRLLAWGLVVVLVDPVLNDFDLLPDLFGWAVVCVVLLALATGSRQLHRAWCAALVGMVSSALSFALFFSEQPQRLVAAVLHCTDALAWAAFAWFLLAGLAERAQGSDRPAAEQARRLGRVLLVLNGLQLVLAIGALAAGSRAHTYAWDSSSWLGSLAWGLDLLVTLANLALLVYLLRHASRPWVEPNGARVGSQPA